MSRWNVICRPVEDNPGSRSRRNEGGLAVVLVDADDLTPEGQEGFEVTRVTYARRNSRNPDRAFEDQLQEELAKAWDAVESLQALDDQLEDERRAARREARERVREILGEPQRIAA